MDSSQYPGGGRRQLKIKGPRPSPLSVHKIKKPPPPPPHPHPQQPHQQLPDRCQPQIIYAVSPKVVHANVDDFMTVVQPLTGLTSGDFSNAGYVSPAARLASTEKTRPSAEREKFDDLMDLVEGVEFRQLPGILSPAPLTLPPLPASYFSPVSAPSTLSLLHDLSPFFHGNGSWLIASPSALFSMYPIASPDVFAQFWVF